MASDYNAFNTLAADLHLGRWSTRRFGLREIEDRAASVMQEKPSVFAFRISGGQVVYEAGAGNEIPAFRHRADLYQNMLSLALADCAISTTLLFDLEDFPSEHEDLPVFSFQKRRGTSNILLPDMEMVLSGFGAPAGCAAKAFEEKRSVAQFFGSTTGVTVISAEVACAMATPRLDAYRFFRDSNEVDFTLPHIVQCDSPETEDILRAEGIGGPRRSINDAFEVKFIISIDGNGAACSRPLFALHSSSVLLKYDSEYVLYWTDLMIPNLHYLPIGRHSDVVEIVRREREHPGEYRHVAEAGAAYAKQNLGCEAVINYIRTVVSRYSSIVDGGRRGLAVAKTVSLDQVSEAFEAILGRPVDDPSQWIRSASLGSAIRTILSSPEFSFRMKSGALWYSNSKLDLMSIVASHDNPRRAAVPGRIVNFLGVVIDPAYIPHVLTPMAGQVQGLPFPANWHADLAEFAAALRAVDLAGESFRVIELGCSWGCWMANTGVAARNRGKSVELLGVEANADHIASARSNMRENGFAGPSSALHHAIVGPSAGTALFPRQERAGVYYGLQSIPYATPRQIAKAGDRYDVVSVMTLGMVAGERPVDLLHMDIQGGEADFIDACIADLDAYVRYLVVGTYSRLIEGRITEALLARDWRLEIERPALYGFGEACRPEIKIAGVQGWRNPRLSG